ARRFAARIACGSIALKGARTEPEYAAAQVAQREHDARAKAVVWLPALSGALGQAGRVQLLLVKAALARGQQHAVPCARRVSHFEFPQHRLLEAPHRQVLACPDRLARLPQVTLVVVARPREQLEQPLASAALLSRAGILLLALQLHPIALGQQLERALEVKPLGLLHEREHIARGLAAEAVIDL